MTKIKICCVSSIKEANMAISAGADIIGLVGHMPNGPGIISDALIADIASTIPKGIESWLLTSETESHSIIHHHQRVITSGIQLVDGVSINTYQTLKEALPNVKLIQVVHVIDEVSINEAKKVAPYIDCLLLDSGKPQEKVRTLGGTGKIHNWQISKRIVEEVDIPVYLAGGLSIDNVKDAIHTVGPYGVDACSRLRTDDHLNNQKLTEYIKIIKNTK